MLDPLYWGGRGRGRESSGSSNSLLNAKEFLNLTNNELPSNPAPQIIVHERTITTCCFLKGMFDVEF